MNNNSLDVDINRQNILNNDLALEKIEEIYNFRQSYFTNQQVANFFDISIPTLERTISEHRVELERNDFSVLSGKKLNDFREQHPEVFETINNDGLKVRNIAISSIRTVLNLSMLLKTSSVAQELRSKILDVTVEVLQEKTKGNVKYINQRDNSFLEQSYREKTERKQFTNALNNYVDMNAYKYAYFTDEIYKAIFKEQAKDYKKLLDLKARENVRDTLYSEVLVLIASFEAGLAYEIEIKHNELDRKLTQVETKQILDKFSSHPLQKPLIDNARTKMASRDYGFRSVVHSNISDYINPMNKDDFEKFLGEKSKSLQEQITENIDVFKRLKDK